jgi:para-nitrobenzyl esterase
MTDLKHVAPLRPVPLVNGDSVVGLELDPSETGAASTVRVFRGIRFAEPPIGTYRFRPSVAKVGSATVFPADEFGPMAPQTPGMLETAFGAAAPVYDEADCLSLNVWAPAGSIGGATAGAMPAIETHGLPVMMWIHGGAYLTGSGSIPWYDGSRFAGTSNVVLVTINYRLGALGYLAHPDLPGSGNAGLSDQLLALRWVNENIAAFGGDPKRVTVFGESAGAFSAAAVLASPSARGHLNRAILQSGAGAHTWPIATSTEVAEAFLAALDSSVERLETAGIDAIIAAQNAVIASDTFGGLPFQPTHGTPLLPEAPLEAIRANRGAQPSAVLHGTNLDEYRLFTAFNPAIAAMTDEDLFRKAHSRFGEGVGEAIEAYRSIQPTWSAAHVWSAMQTDTVFRQPAQELARALAEADIPSWQYLFAWGTAAFGGGLGACHALEIPFVFDALHQTGVSMFVGSDPALADLAANLHASWVAFAHGHEPRTDWPRESADARGVYRFHLDGTQGVVHDPFSTERALWPVS